jgi:hypothetical protein
MEFWYVAIFILIKVKYIGIWFGRTLVVLEHTVMNCCSDYHNWATSPFHIICDAMENILNIYLLNWILVKNIFTLETCLMLSIK